MYEIVDYNSSMSNKSTECVFQQNLHFYAYYLDETTGKALFNNGNVRDGHGGACSF
jgi:hypothetical protein